MGKIKITARIILLAITTAFLLTVQGCTMSEATGDMLPPIDAEQTVNTDTGQYISLNANEHSPLEPTLTTIQPGDIDIIYCEKEIRDKTYIIYLGKDGGVYGAYRDGDYYIDFLTISPAEFEYAYTNSDPFEILEYTNVLNTDGFIIKFIAGAKSVPINYYYWDETGTLKLLAQGDIANYEYDFDGDGTKELLFIYGNDSLRFYKITNNELTESTLPENIGDYYRDMYISFDEEKSVFEIKHHDEQGNARDVSAKYDYGRLLFIP